MTKLVNFLKINFILILVCFFLPFFPFFSCGSEKNEQVSSIDSTTVAIDTTEMAVDTTNLQIVSNSILNQTDSLIKENDSSDSKKSDLMSNSIISYLSFTKYKSSEGVVSITGFGMLMVFLESILSGEFDYSEWGNYVFLISFLACIFGLLVSIKSRKRKHQFLFVCSLIGFAAISAIGFLVGNLSELFFGFWMVVVLYLINALLGFILWKNYSLEKTES
jgi:hypothetical protein